ncbi:unnamed protein product, partial [Polarella glacialis]
VLCAILVAVTQGVTNGPDAEATQLGQIAVILIWAEASIAILSTLYLLFGDAGVIKRTEESCYPIPSEVEQRIRALQSLDSLKNIPGPQGDIRHGSYCVRCLVWRSKDAGKVHHCNVCQRCVTGFDHHCGVFGRCIVRNNMPCFLATIGMMFAGMITAMLAVMSSTAVNPQQGGGGG